MSNWYKQSQKQQLLLYPWNKSISNVEEQQPPDYIDPKTNESFYKCLECGKLHSLDDETKWFENPDRTNPYSLYAELDVEKIISEANILVDAIRKKKDEIAVEASKIKEDQEFVFRYEEIIDVSDIVNLTKNSPNLLKMCRLDNTTQMYWGYHNSICGIVRNVFQNESFATKKISPQTFTYSFEHVVEDFEERIRRRVPEIIKTLSDFSTKVLSPVCPDCEEDMETCEGCNKLIFDAEENAYPLTWGNNYVCKECMESGGWHMCDECGKVMSDDEGRFGEDYTYCDECFQENMSYDKFYHEIEDRASNNPDPFKDWFEKGKDHIYLDYDVNEDMPESDQEIQKYLEEHNCFTNNTDYRAGYCYMEKRRLRIGKLLEKLRKNKIKDMTKRFEKIKGHEEYLKRILDKINFFFNDIVDKYMRSDYRSLKDVSDLKIIVSKDPHDIAKMSFERNWTSCMNLAENAGAAGNIYCEVEEGGLIAYLVRKDDSKIERPISRVLLRRYVNDAGDSLAIPEETIYGDDKIDFLPAIQEWLDSKQKNLPKGTYGIRGMDYVENLPVQYEKTAIMYLERLIKMAKSNWYKKINKQASIQFEPPNTFDPTTEEVITIDINKFDQEWSKNPFYISKDGTGANQGKYQYYQNKYDLDEISTIEMPNIQIGDDGYGNKVVGFQEGRHRYAVMRDNGETHLQIVIPRSEINEFSTLI
jgi:hypothetical protein